MLGIVSKTLLFPYFIALKIRHFLYDKQIKKSKAYPIPIICVGNITVGGTGKTPHTEMIIRLLRGQYKMAVLSRGYKRKSKGFHIVKATDTFREAGDEPLQIKQKFPEVMVAVCKSRREGIEKLLALPEQGSSVQPGKPDIIILDDAFQHRKVKPSHSIVLVNYNNPIYNDNLLPAGTLRDLPEQIKRADTVIISKSPVAVELDGLIDEQQTLRAVQEEGLIWRKQLKLRENQNLYFSTITYTLPKPVFQKVGDLRYVYSGTAIFFTGIANDLEFRNNLVGKYKVLDSLKFADHKNFSKSDIRRINHWAKSNPTAVIFTTEKDSKRLLESARLDENVKVRLFYIPIEVSVIPNVEQQHFISRILR